MFSPRSKSLKFLVSKSIEKLHKMMNKVQHFVDAQEKLIVDVKSIKGEQKLTYTALSACLDGLEQLGANHTVPIAKAQLTEWLNERAHDD